MIGLDIEPYHRFVHPGVARMITSTGAAEATPVSSGTIPLLALLCVKEAIYKSDPLQSGRTLADYAWIEAHRFMDHGWCGIAEAVCDRTQRFTVAAACIKGNWLAVALAERYA